jgi:UDP-N-acetylglucosamine--N-acetylmuramyl-(pentapeptide) pyrophosphoryl-undecaprenol N-acetylglucosamine transferase
MKIVLAGGGTAGHVEPALAIADELQASSLAKQEDIHFIGGFRGLEGKLVPARGYQLHQIEIVGLPRKFGIALFKYPIKLNRAKQRLEDLFREIKPDLVLGFGGYVSAPSYLAARNLGIPFVIHEANAKPGVANRLAAKHATLRIESFSGTMENALTLGVPVRTQIANLERGKLKSQAMEFFDLPNTGKTLLVFGGSQGAERINQSVAQIVERLLSQQINVLHIVGELNLSRYQRKSKSGLANYVVLGYCNRMDLAYAAADLAITRSGALTVAELACAGLPAILVPYPVGNGEQELNAAELVAAGGAQLLMNKDCSAEQLLNMVTKLIHDSELLSQMGHQAKTIARPNAAKDIVEQIRKLTSDAAA